MKITKVAPVNNNFENENSSKHIRDLSHNDKERAEQQLFEQLKTELQRAFAEPDSSYVELSAEDIFRP